jgi:4-carboxymuconolactone decarboxylase
LKVSAAVPPRLPLIDVPEDPLAHEVFAKLASGRGILNLHRMMAHAPALMKASGDMAMVFRNDAMLARSLAEIVVLRTAQVVDCDYVWGRHLSLARAAGVTEQQIEEVARWPDSLAFTPAQKTALGFAEKVARGAPIETGTFAALHRDFSPREIVELTMLVGFYVSTAIFIKTLAVPDEKA